MHNQGRSSTTTDVAAAQTTVENEEYGDAAATIAYKEPRNKYRKHNKSRRSNADANYSGMIWDVAETHSAVLS